MNDVKEKLKHLIKVKKISAIQLLSEDIGLAEDEVIATIQEMIQEGILEGHFSDDNSRFFLKLDIPEPPTRTVEEEPLPFMEYDTRPGKIVALLGLSVMIAGAILHAAVAGNELAENAFYIMSFIGVATMICGCYYIGRRPTP